MSRFTYQSESNGTPLETYEWDNVWIEQTANLDGNRVLYIGDSISCGTRNTATSISSNKYLFDGFGTSKALDNPFLFDSIRLFASQLTKTETVIFNNGLHGWHLNDSTEYRELYEKAIRFLLEEFKGKKIFLVLTTSVANPDRESRVKARNGEVCKLSEKYGLPVIDLYSTSAEYAKFRTDDGVHFTSDGYRELARKILKELESENYGI